MYEPEVGDYVIWDRGEYGKDEGWVYFKCDKEPSFNLKGIEHARYITIETGVRPKPECRYTKNEQHKMILIAYKTKKAKVKSINLQLVTDSGCNLIHCFCFHAISPYSIILK